MVYTTSNLKQNEWWKFLLRRIFRILPIYWLCLVIYWILVIPETNIKKLLEAALLIPNSYQGPPGFGFSLLGVAWTLTYEMIFYIYFAFFILIIPKSIRDFIYPLLIISVTFGIQYAIDGIISIDPANSPVMSHDSYINRIIGVMANPLFLLFAVGAFLGEIYQVIAIKTQERIIINLICTLLFMLALAICWNRPETHGLNGVGISAILIVISVLILDHSNQSNHSKPIKMLGDWSYSLYLTHEIILEYVAIISPAFWVQHDSPIDFLLLAIVVIGVSAIFYKTVEKSAINIANALCDLK